MSDATETLRDLIRDLQPLHAAMALFEKGGRERARDIERIYEALVTLERGLEDEGDEEEGP